jgi:GxxExxY protein
MHKNFQKADRLSAVAIAAAIEVHRHKGSGLLESIYEKCMLREFYLRGVSCKTQVNVRIGYKGYTFEETLKLDIIVDDCLLLELKSVKEIIPIHKAQLMSYMKVMDTPLGLILNFGELYLKNGICRMMLPGANEKQ